MPKPLIQTTGRRKEAVARVRMRNGTGKITVNGRTFESYFPILTHQVIAKEPLRLTQTEEVYDVDATLDGGGVSGQAGAIRLGIARALIALDPDTRPVAQEGRPARSRRAREGAAQVRPQEGPQGAAVLQAVGADASPCCGSAPTVSAATPDTDLTTPLDRRARPRRGAGARRPTASSSAATRGESGPRIEADLAARPRTRRARRVRAARRRRPRPRSRSSRSAPGCRPRSSPRATTRGATTA